MADDDNDVQMSTNTDTTMTQDNNNKDDTKIDNKDTTENKTVEVTQSNDQNNDNNSNDKPPSKIEQEEKKESDVNSNSNIHNSNFGMNPLMLVQAAMNDFLNEMNSADVKASTLYHSHIEKQQRLMNQFVSDSLKLMHEFNMGLDPIHNVLKKLKSPLQDVLLS